MSNLDELTAALNGHEVTNDLGEIEEPETSMEEDVPSDEETTDEESASPEKAEDTPEEASKEGSDQLAEDDSGKRYVPEDRFKKVYGDKKRLERELEAFRRQNAQRDLNAPAPSQGGKPTKVDKAELLEQELLYQTLPQFNPYSSEYDQDLDSMGYEILQANPGITKLEAGRRALARAAKLTHKVAEIRGEARQVKSLQSDQGITSRVNRGASGKLNVDDMSLEEHEEYLKANGLW